MADHSEVLLHGRRKAPGWLTGHCREPRWLTKHGEALSRKVGMACAPMWPKVGIRHDPGWHRPALDMPGPMGPTHQRFKVLTYWSRSTHMGLMVMVTSQ